MKLIIRNKRGITLIALIITIVMLLILAGVAISSIKEDGIPIKASEATDEHIKAEITEVATLGHMECCLIKGIKSDSEIQSYIDNYMKNSSISEKDLEDYTILAGTWGVKVFKNDEVGKIVNVKDYGASGDGSKDDTLAIREAVDFINSDSNTEFFTLYFPNGVYKVSILKESYSDKVVFDANGNLKSATDGETGGNVIKITNTTAKAIVIDFAGSTLELEKNSYPGWQIISAVDSKNLIIKNGTLIGDRKEHIYLPGDGSGNGGLSDHYETHEHAHGMRLVRCSNVTVENMNISNMPGDGICISGKVTSITTINNCNIHHCRRQGVTVSVSDTTNISNSKIHHIGTHDGIAGTMPMAGVDIEPSPRDTKVAKNVNIQNTSITEITEAGVVVGGSVDIPCEKLSILNCTIEKLDPQAMCGEAIVNNSTLIYNKISYVEKAIIHESKIEITDNTYVRFDTCEITSSVIEATDNGTGRFTIAGEEFILNNNIFKNFKGGTNTGFSDTNTGLKYPLGNSGIENRKFVELCRESYKEWN